jgi:hypothetical protein
VSLRPLYLIFAWLFPIILIGNQIAEYAASFLGLVWFSPAAPNAVFWGSLWRNAFAGGGLWALLYVADLAGGGRAGAAAAPGCTFGPPGAVYGRIS